MRTWVCKSVCMCDFLAAVCQCSDHEGTKEVVICITLHQRAVIDRNKHTVSFIQVEDAAQVAVAPLAHRLGFIGAAVPTAKTFMTLMLTEVIYSDF